MSEIEMALQYFARRLAPSFVVFVLVQFVIRLIFTVWTFQNLGFADIVKSYATGIVFDLATYSLFILPYIVYLLVLPTRWLNTRLDRIATHICFVIFAGMVIFDIASEYAFWQEFAVRFNFIAVDYLVYAREVLGNIWESYPIIPLSLGILTLVGIAYYFFKDTLLPTQVPNITLQSKASVLVGFLCLAFGGFYAVSLDFKNVTNNNYANEIAANGIYSLFSAFRNNELAYKKFYITYEDITHSDLPATPPRLVRAARPEMRKNVIFIVMESMSAAYMNRYGSNADFTPNLDALAAQSLNFSNMYATGTRTVRGLEALTLSIPPSPGRSIVKRPGNENLFSLGEVFHDRNYHNKFIYGGYGYFDNMNYFFKNNGFDVVDRVDMSDDEITFSNVWGVADENLFAKVITEARADSQTGNPFMYMVMTTSNHRPYTFPENNAGIPTEGGGRIAGVRYADYAIGKFFESAKKEPWFENTVFVIVADHTAGAAGKSSLPPGRYHIPAMIYAPGMIAPREVEKVASQIDLPVTLLSLLGFSYKSEFYGQDILDEAFSERAFIATHQKLGILADDKVTFVEPVKKYGIETASGDVMAASEVEPKSLTDVVLSYESASQWKSNHKKLATTLIGAVTSSLQQ